MTHFCCISKYYVICIKILNNSGIIMRVKFVFISFLMLLALSSCSLFDKISNKSEFEYMPEHTPESKYKFDVKTKYLEKYDLTGVKNGAIAYLGYEKWAELVEIDENYSLWIKNIKRDTSELPYVSVSFDLELQDPSFQFEGNPIKKKTFVIRYSSNYEIEKSKGSPGAKAAEEILRNYAEYAKSTGKISAYVNNMFIKKAKSPYVQVCAYVLDYINNTLNDSQTWKYKQVESIICGAEIMGQLKEWMWEIEQGKNKTKPASKGE